MHQVKEDLTDFGLKINLTQLRNTSINSMKKLVKKHMKEFSLNYLTTIQESHSKMDDLVYPRLKLQNYLKDGKISVQAAKTLFK